MIENTEDQDSGTGSNAAAVKQSLNAVYGHGVGFLQSLSLFLNASLMVYAHMGLSAVILSNQKLTQNAAVGVPPAAASLGDNNSSAFVPTDMCTEYDHQIWKTRGLVNRIEDGTFCALEYNGSGCLLVQTCYAECFEKEIGYSMSCANCFATVPLCSLQQGCFICQSDSASDECIRCTLPCNSNFQMCSGLAIPASTTNETAIPGKKEDSRLEESESEVCARQTEGVDIETIDEYFVAYKLLFFPAVETAWNSNARLLAVLVVFFSGVFPYAKNVILLLAWYLRLTVKQRSTVFLWLKMLGKYTLVDVYIVILLMIGLILELSIAGSTPVVIKGEPRGAIIAFLVATVWEFVHLEWMVSYHDKCNLKQGERGVMRTEETCNPVVSRTTLYLLLATSFSLFAIGSNLRLLQFTTILAGETIGCTRSYTLCTLGGALVSDFFLYRNDAKPGVWTLCVGYILFALAAPLSTNLLQATVTILNLKSPFLCRVLDICWTFASVEVLLVGIFIVQVRLRKFSSDSVHISSYASHHFSHLSVQVL